MNYLIISHSADWDGLMSATILYYELNKDIVKEDSITIKLFNYNDDEKLIIDNIKNSDLVYISDISLSDKTMKEFEDKIIYIDHHTKTINHLLEFCNFAGGIHNIDGTKSAARLCYEYFHGKDCEIPECINYISEYDISGGINKPEEVSLYQLGLKTLPFNINTCSKLLHEIISTENVIQKGITATDFINNNLNINILKQTWNVVINGYKGKALLTDWSNTLHIKDLLMFPDISFVLCINILNNSDKNHYSVSIRVNPNSNFNAAEFASRFEYNGRKGGGHPKAAGCVITEEQFLKLRNEGIL